MKITYILAALVAIVGLNSCAFLGRSGDGRMGEVVTVTASSSSPGDEFIVLSEMPEDSKDVFGRTGTGTVYSNQIGKEVFFQVAEDDDDGTIAYKGTVAGNLSGVRHFVAERRVDGELKLQAIITIKTYDSFYSLEVHSLKINDPEIDLGWRDKDVDVMIFADLQLPNPRSPDYISVLQETFQITGVKKKCDLKFKDEFVSAPVASPRGGVRVQGFVLKLGFVVHENLKSLTH